MADATIKLKGDKGHLEKTLHGAESDVKGFGGRVRDVFAALGVAGLIGKAFSFGKDAITQAAAIEESQVRLKAVVESSGNAAGFSIDQIGKMVEQVNRLQHVSKGAAREAATMIAGFSNIRGDGFQRLLELSADFSKATGGEMKQAANDLGKALNDPMKGMEQLAEKGIIFTESQKQAVASMIATGDVAGAQALMLKKLEERYGGIAEKMGGTMQARLDRVKEKFNDFSKLIGGALLSAVEWMLPWLESAAGYFQNSILPGVQAVIDIFTEWGKTIGEYLQPILKGLVDAMAWAFTAVTVAIESWRDIATIAFESFMLAGVKAFNTVVHYLGTVLPDLLSWFGRNWTKVFMDMGNFIGTAFTNMFENAKNFFSAIWSWIKGDGFNFEWTGLLDGFKATLDEMPKIAERQKGAVETALEIDIDARSKRVGKSFDEQYKANKAAFEAAYGLDGKGSPSQTAAAGRDQFASAASKSPYEVTGAPGKDGDKGGGEKAAKDQGKATGAKADFVGLEDLNKRIQAAAAGGKSEQKLDKVAEASRETSEKTGKVAEASRETSKNTADAATYLQALVAAATKIVEALPTIGALR